MLHHCFLRDGVSLAGDLSKRAMDGVWIRCTQMGRYTHLTAFWWGRRVDWNTCSSSFFRICSFNILDRITECELYLGSWSRLSSLSSWGHSTPYLPSFSNHANGESNRYEYFVQQRHHSHSLRSNFAEHGAGDSLA